MLTLVFSSCYRMMTWASYVTFKAVTEAADILTSLVDHRSGFLTDSCSKKKIPLHSVYRKGCHLCSICSENSERARSRENFLVSELALRCGTRGFQLKGSNASGEQHVHGPSTELSCPSTLGRQPQEWNIEILTVQFANPSVVCERTFPPHKELNLANTKYKWWEGSRGSLLEGREQSASCSGWQLSGYIQCKNSRWGTLWMLALHMCSAST